MGQEQIVASGFEAWRAKITVGIRRPEQRLNFRAMMAQSRGRVGTWSVPVCAGFQIIDPLTSGDFSSDFSSDFSHGAEGAHEVRIVEINPIQRATFGDASTFSDAAVFETKLVMGTMAADFFKGDTAISVRSPLYQPLAGQYFSIGDYLYLITSGVSTGGVNYWLTFAPPLRGYAKNETAVDFSRPSCLMRLASDDEGQLELESLRFADVSLNFVEVPPSA